MAIEKRKANFADIANVALNVAQAGHLAALRESAKKQERAQEEILGAERLRQRQEALARSREMARNQKEADAKTFFFNLLRLLKQIEKFAGEPEKFYYGCLALHDYCEVNSLAPSSLESISDMERAQAADDQRRDIQGCAKEWADANPIQASTVAFLYNYAHRGGRERIVKGLAAARGDGELERKRGALLAEEHRIDLEIPTIKQQLTERQTSAQSVDFPQMPGWKMQCRRIGKIVAPLSALSLIGYAAGLVAFDSWTPPPSLVYWFLGFGFLGFVLLGASLPSAEFTVEVQKARERKKEIKRELARLKEKLDDKEKRKAQIAGDLQTLSTLAVREQDVRRNTVAMLKANGFAGETDAELISEALTELDCRAVGFEPVLDDVSDITTEKQSHEPQASPLVPGFLFFDTSGNREFPERGILVRNIGLDRACERFWELSAHCFPERRSAGGAREEVNRLITARGLVVIWGHEGGTRLYAATDCPAFSELQEERVLTMFRTKLVDLDWRPQLE